MGEPPSTDLMTPAAYHILLSLADRPRHGYGIMQEVDTRSAGHVRLGPGTLYRSIKQLRSAGLIEADANQASSDANDRRRVYRITERGLNALTNEARRLEQLVAQARGKGVLDHARPA
ncbi:MAG: PadR family transcriptional regulator [Gemmatimonadota bacterium]|nr:MAG: PadR family transcriptional regulator [Gemmatimonadota bacterium]